MRITNIDFSAGEWDALLLLAGGAQNTPQNTLRAALATLCAVAGQGWVLPPETMQAVQGQFAARTRGGSRANTGNRRKKKFDKIASP